MGTPIFALFGKHHCIECGSKLQLKKYSRVVTKDSEDAKRYNYDGFGDFKVVWKKFYCPHCNRNIECATQISFEKFLRHDKLIENELNKHFDPSSISKKWITVQGMELNHLPIPDGEMFNETLTFTYFIKYKSEVIQLEAFTTKRKSMREKAIYIQKNRNLSIKLREIVSKL